MRESSMVVEQLQGALNSRILIEQAKGVLAERLNVSVDDAFALLRNHSRNGNLKLRDVAAEVVSGRLNITAPSPRSPKAGAPDPGVT